MIVHLLRLKTFFSRSNQPLDGCSIPNGFEFNLLINFNTLFSNECKLQVIFKSGTRVDISCWKCDTLNIRITPSIEDFNLTDGLCQNFNGIQEARLEKGPKYNGTSPAVCPQHYSMPKNFEHFIESWR